MPAAKPILDFTSPNWAPLHLVVPADQAELFMWMHGCVWADGFRLEAYKHHVTRQYLYLSEDGAAYMPGEHGTLHLVDVRSALDATATASAGSDGHGRPPPPTRRPALRSLAARRRHPGPRRRRRC